MEILKSRRFISSVIGGVVMLIIASLPGLQSSEDLLVEAFTVLVLALVGGYTAEDVFQPKTGRGKPEITVVQQADDALTLYKVDTIPRSAKLTQSGLTKEEFDRLLYNAQPTDPNRETKG